jgi:peptidyl-prolyl cis-trans isomerase D
VKISPDAGSCEGLFHENTPSESLHQVFTGLSTSAKEKDSFMLARIREKASSWMVKFILGIIVLVFVFLGVESYHTGKQNRVAVVNGTVITVDAYRAEYQSLVDQIRRQFGGVVSPEILELFQVQEQALQRLIDRQLLMQEAKTQKLQVTDAEVTAAIAAIPVFQTDGRFDAALYRRLLEANGMNAVFFEERQREDLLLGKLQELIFGGVHVSKAEALDFYNAQNQKIAMEALVLRPLDFTPEPVTEKALVARYESHKESYRTEPMVKAAYLRFDPEELKDRIEITDEEVRQAYEMHIEDFREPERVSARHILFQVDENADQNLVDAKYQELMALRERIVQGMDFSDAAREHSQCPSASDGGRLGIFPREAMVPAFSEAAFALELNGMSLPVRTRFGWHLIHVDERLPEGVKPYEAVAGELRSALKEEKAKNQSYDMADAVYDATLAGADLKEVAATWKLTLHETSFFGRRGPSSGVVDARRFAETAFSLAHDEVSELVEIGDALFLISIVDRQESSVPPMDAVRERMVAELEREGREAMAKSKAQTILVALQKGEHPEIPLVETGFFGREEEIPKLGALPMLNRAAFALDKESTIPDEPVRLNEGYAVFRITGRTLPDAASFETERPRLERELKNRKQNRMYGQWMASLREKAKIEIEPAFRQEG